MSVDVDELEIEWDNHFALPVANAENKLLEEAIAKIDDSESLSDL